MVQQIVYMVGRNVQITSRSSDQAIKRGLVCVVFVNDIQIWERKADEFFGETDVVAQLMVELRCVVQRY